MGLRVIIFTDSMLFLKYNSLFNDAGVAEAF